jgi:hypothetical protein
VNFVFLLLSIQSDYILPYFGKTINDFTSWGNEMKFTEKIEKELIYSNDQNL